MRIRLKKLAVILLVVMVAALAAGLLLLFPDPSVEKEADFASGIENRLAEQVTKLSNQADQLIVDIPEGKGLSLKTDFAFFLVKDGAVVAWTDHHIASPTPSVIETGELRFVRTPGGEFLFRKWKVDESRDLIGAIPLYRHYKIRNQYLTPRYNRSIFGKHEFDLLEVTSDKGVSMLFNGEPLFKLRLKDESVIAGKGSANPWGVFMIALSIFVSFLFLIESARHVGQRHPGVGFLILSVGVVAIRFGMILTNFPTDYVDSPVFDPKNFASSELNPSMGDLLINSLCTLILCTYLLQHFTRFYLVRVALQKPALGFITFGFSAVAIFFGMLFPYVVIQTIYHNSQISLSITRSLQVDVLRFVALFSVLISWVSAFMFTHVFVRLLTQSGNWVKFIVSLVVGVLIFSLINEMSGQAYYIVLVTMLIFLMIVLALKLNKTLTKFKYDTFIYLVTAIIVISINSTSAIERFELKEQVQHQVRFANNFLVDRDYFGEFLLRETLDKIRNDAFIATRMVGPIPGKDAMKQKIKQYHMPGYFNKYNVEVRLFSASGSSLDDPNAESFAELVNRYNKEANKTDYVGVYFVGNIMENLTRQYIAYTSIYRGETLVGYTVLELSLKKFIPESVYPELLVDTRFQQVSPPARLSYAVFVDREPQLSSGDYNYDLFGKERFSNRELYSTGMHEGGFVHIASEDSGGKIAVVSTPEQPYFFILADFSFLVILGLAAVFIFLLLLGAYNIYMRRSLYLSARIQLIINLAFFVPLIGVSVVTLGLTANASQEQINNEYLAKSKSVAGQLGNALGEYRRTSIETSFNELVRLAGMDANLFSQDGKLVVTSQPEIFENQLLGGLINSAALARVKRGDKNFVREENVGSLSYFVAYSTVYSAGSGNLVGVVALPFFQSASSLERMQISVLANILLIFMILFVVLLIISALVSRWLTYPLTMITQKLGKISLVDANQPITWDSKDEIGIMVREYNNMLEKLSENKVELERTQREQAWREIAQQVAHEIKNPLTPMKLTLQQLERSLGKGKSEKIDRSLSSLLTQIDSLDGIASSFSTFAKMPEPVLSHVELVRLTENIVELHKDTGAKFSTNESEVVVIADKQLIGRIFSNLILNGLQACKVNAPQVTVKLKREKDFCRVSFIDAGVGIEPELRDKIFLPHFTTKEAGSGLGLAIAKQGIEQMGGKIWFETEMNIGTTFHVELPIAD